MGFNRTGIAMKGQRVGYVRVSTHEQNTDRQLEGIELDRCFTDRASGLNLITAAIVLWNTVYLQRAVAALREQGRSVDDDLLQYLSPLGWEHINLTGDYVWRRNAKVGAGKFRPLRPLAEA